MMKHSLLLLALPGLLVGCSSRTDPAPGADRPVTTTRLPAVAPTPAIAILFERLLPGGTTEPPLFGPDGSITVGARQWSRDGRYRGRHAWFTGGQVRPIAVTGSVDRPQIVAVGWSDLEGMPGSGTAERGADFTWLLTADPRATKPMGAIRISHGFLDDGFELSPDGAALAASEDDQMVVRALPSGAVLARAPIGEPLDAAVEPVACWVDDARIAWAVREAGQVRLRTMAIHGGALSSVPLATASATLWCDPAGGAAAIPAPTGAVTLVDLTTGASLASLAVHNNAEVAVAVGEHGRRIAIATERTLTVYHRDGGRVSPMFTRTKSTGAPGSAENPRPLARLRFSADGARLAVATTTLVVIGPASEARSQPQAPEIAFHLPAGFVSVPPGGPEQQAWQYAQLPAPSGFTRLPALLVNAIAHDQAEAEVVALALDRDELAGVPAPSASDAEITSFAKTAMPQLFGSWIGAKIGTGRDAQFTLRVGRTDGMPWFETRELWQDGCEPYDGYTRVVVDREVVFVIRALTVPGGSIGGSIDGWLAQFFDLPFGVRTKTARRPGRSLGPC